MPELDMRAQVCDWLTTLDVDPNHVPITSDLYIETGAAGRELHYEAYVLNATGHRIPDERGNALVERRAVPLSVEPPEHWQPFRKPTLEQVTAERDEARAALAALHEGEEPDGDPLAEPTPAQWIWRWNRATPELRLRAAADFMANSAQAGHCRFMRHDARLAEYNAKRGL